MTVLPFGSSEPKPEVSADENGVRIFFPSDDNTIVGRVMGLAIITATTDYPLYALDYAEAVPGGILIDLINPKAHL